jgi:hypothetical protein
MPSGSIVNLPPNEEELRVIYPMFAMVILTAVVLVTLFRARVAAVREGRVSLAYFGIYQGAAEPESSAKAVRHFANLFETPVLFYVACLAAMITNVAGAAMQALAWAYVAARVAHAYVHLGANRIRHRLRVYFASCLVLLAMWIYLVAAVTLSRS